MQITCLPHHRKRRRCSACHSRYPAQSQRVRCRELLQHRCRRFRSCGMQAIQSLGRSVVSVDDDGLIWKYDVRQDQTLLSFYTAAIRPHHFWKRSVVSPFLASSDIPFYHRTPAERRVKKTSSCTSSFCVPPFCIDIFQTPRGILDNKKSENNDLLAIWHWRSHRCEPSSFSLKLGGKTPQKTKKPAK